jgi:hypothetical protein
MGAGDELARQMNAPVALTLIVLLLGSVALLCWAIRNWPEGHDDEER